MDRRENLSSFLGLFGLSASNIKIEDVKDTKRKCCEKHKDFPNASLTFYLQKEVKPSKAKKQKNVTNSLFLEADSVWTIKPVETVQYNFCYVCIIEKLVEIGVPMAPQKVS